MTLRFEYAVQSDSVDRMLAAWQSALGDHTEAFEQIAEDFRESVARQFSTEGRAEGTPWLPRKRAGAVRLPRAQPRGEPPLLIHSGTLLRSLTVPGAPGSVEELAERSLLLGTRVPYARYHQEGTRHLPARPIIVLSGARAATWVEIVRRNLEEKVLLFGPKELQ